MILKSHNNRTSSERQWSLQKARGTHFRSLSDELLKVLTVTPVPGNNGLIDQVTTWVLCPGSHKGRQGSRKHQSVRKISSYISFPNLIKKKTWAQREWSCCPLTFSSQLLFLFSFISLFSSCLFTILYLFTVSLAPFVKYAASPKILLLLISLPYSILFLFLLFLLFLVYLTPFLVLRSLPHALTCSSTILLVHTCSSCLLLL